jgi:hypothetical protein
MSTTEIAPVANLQEARKEQAAAKGRHPAGKQAPAKAPAAKPTTKITWKLDGEKDAKGQAEGTGTCGDRTYRITREGDAWKATVKVGNKTTVLAENVGSGKSAWQKCVDHNKSAA